MQQKRLDLAGDAIDQAIAGTTEEHVNQALYWLPRQKYSPQKLLFWQPINFLSCRVRVLLYLNSTLTVTGNARTHTLHDPVRWKYHIVGNYYLNGVQPPRHAWS